MANKERLPNVTLEDVRILFRNFSGKEGRFNREGDRNFNVIIPEDLIEPMRRDGWNLRTLKPREEGEEPDTVMQVAVNYAGRPPRVVMITSRGKTNLDEETIELLDYSYITKADLIVRPYQWEINGKSGVKAYLMSLYVTIREDELEKKYADVPDSAMGSITGNEFFDEEEG